MKIETLLLLGVAVFFALIGVLYWAIPYAVHEPLEQAGILMLVGCVLLGLIPGIYYGFWAFYKKMKARPEDRSDATIEQGSGAIGTFPSSSVWPFVFGMGAFLTALSAVFGFWLLAPGLVLGVMAVTGYTAESRRGGHI